MHVWINSLIQSTATHIEHIDGLMQKRRNSSALEMEFYLIRMRHSISCCRILTTDCDTQDDVIKWKNVPRNWPFVRGIHRWPMNSPHKGQWRGALMFSLICVWMGDWVNNREAGDLRRHRAHNVVTVMILHWNANFLLKFSSPTASEVVILVAGVIPVQGTWCVTLMFFMLAFMLICNYFNRQMY